MKLRQKQKNNNNKEKENRYIDWGGKKKTVFVCR